MDGTGIVFYGGILLLAAVGIWAVLSRRNVIKVIMGITIIETAVNLLIVAIGYVSGRNAPIVKGDTDINIDPVGDVVDPIPQALVLTAIVIGLATTALALVVAVGHYRRSGTLDLKSWSYGLTDEKEGRK
ncbi:MAG: cation:proton antiporter subunit C [Candidatus Thermoplasmatota archaeon]|nr:cation:proton antiporter subunit C [Candidatus Thermoplasmatota archaeon]